MLRGRPARSVLLDDSTYLVEPREIGSRATRTFADPSTRSAMLRLSRRLSTASQQTVLSVGPMLRLSRRLSTASQAEISAEIPLLLAEFLRCCEEIVTFRVEVD